ncbi:FAD-binding oxidoreductase, partial [Mesorhizobium sp. M7A.T.Ca.TU.009.01.3.1]
DYDLFDELIWPALAHRVPGFEQLRMLRAWAGLYEYNTFDHSGIIGRHPEVSNFVLATGFSGHGMMHAAATGSGVSDLIAYGEYRSVDLSAFRYERIAGNQPIEEHVY